MREKSERRISSLMLEARDDHLNVFWWSFFPQKSGDSKRSWNPNLSWYMIYCQCKDTHYSMGVSTVQSFFLKPSTKDRHFKHGQSAWNTWLPQRGGEKAWFHMGHADIWVVSSNRGVDISKISWWRFGWDSLTESWWTCGGLVLSFLESVCVALLHFELFVNRNFVRIESISFFFR